MSELLGIISPLKKLLSNSREVILVRVNGENQKVLQFNENREFIIPDFQREIRWDSDNLSQLIDDIKSGPKYLGNIILTKGCNEDRYLIVDGQQRITVMTMILSCLNSIHDGRIETIKPCTLTVESFQGFEILINNNFHESLRENPEILISDKLFQINKYYDLWCNIKTNKNIYNNVKAKKFIENLGKSNVNIILNESDDTKEGIRYFIDVNLKGKQLDTEDIFKGYLFRNDSSKEVREAWYELKIKAATIEDKKIKYPMLKLLEHFFYCDLYNEKKYKGLVFDEEFLLVSEFHLHEEPDAAFRSKTHLIEVINDNNYMINSTNLLNRIIDIIINIADSETPNSEFKNLFICKKVGAKIDNDEVKIIHNFMKKILKDDRVLPKALLMKYILTVLVCEKSKEKKDFRKIFAVYLLYVLFMIFESKKSKDIFVNILKVSNEDWYGKAIVTINSYFDVNKITDNKIVAQFKQGTNEDKEDYRFRCKSLATIYNYFVVKNNEVKIDKPINELKRFITDEDAFTTEHFIVSQNIAKELRVNIGKNDSEEEIKYTLNEDIYKRYVNNLFNFIFISRELNSKLSNNWLPKKIEIINSDDKNIECDYSKMVMQNLSILSDSMIECIDSDNYAKDLDLYFYQKFKDKYIECSRNIINLVIERINDKCIP